MLIKVIDILHSPNASLHDDGLLVYQEMKAAVDRHQVPVVVSFDGIKRCTTLFLNASFGKLLTELGEEEMNQYVKPIDFGHILNFDNKFNDMWINVINHDNFQAYREEAHA